MATLDELNTLLASAIQDNTEFDETLRSSYLNRAVRTIAGGVLMPDRPVRLSPPLPDLYSSDTVSTSTNNPYVDLPSTFGRHLFFAAVGDVSVTIFDMFSEFLRHYPSLSMTGTIVAVSSKAGRLYYQGKPSASTDITVHFHRLPVDMSDDEDEPDGIPLHLQESLIVNHAAMEIFNLLEDGIDGKNPNTAIYTSLFNKALLDLEAVVGVDQEPVILEGDRW